MNGSQHIEKLVEKHTSKQSEMNKLKFQGSIEVVWCLVFHACDFRGYYESVDSLKCGYFLIDTIVVMLQ